MNNEEIKNILIKALDYSKKKNYKGWDKHDGLSSIFITIFPFKIKYLNFFPGDCKKIFP